MEPKKWIEELSGEIRRYSRNRSATLGLVIICIFLSMALFADLIAPYPGDAKGVVHFEEALSPPSLKHLFGADEAGRDVLTRVIFGARSSLITAMIVEAAVVLIAVPLGLTAGYVGGKVDSLISRSADVFMSVPPLVLAIAATSAFRPDLIVAAMAVTIAWWPWLARLVYSVVLSVKEEQFIEASRLMGKGTFSIMFVEIFPHIVPVLAAKATMDMGYVILFIASLSFIGLGAVEPTPDWGVMISLGRNQLPRVWWTTSFPGLAIFLTVFGFVLLGDGLRDFLDVQLEETSMT